MTASSPGPDRIRFEGFEADLNTEELFESGRKVRLPQQSFRILAMLLERAGQLVTREQLRARLWPSGVLVEYDRGLNAAVNRLREALKDSAEAPHFIETLPKRGYRFIAATERDSQQDVSPPPLTPGLSGQPGDGQSAAAPQVSRLDAHETAVGPPERPSMAVEPGRPRAARFRRELVFSAAAALVTVLLIAGTLSVLTHRSATRLATSRQVVPLTSLPGQAVAPTFSPDGSQIAFAWNGGSGDGHQFDLYVTSLGSERLLQLTHHPSNWIKPAWSPDGGAIAFLRQDADQFGLFVIPALGGSERRIVSSRVWVGPSSQISWSPNGRLLAFSGYGSTGAAQVQFVSLDTLTQQALSPAPDCLEAGQPAFSPDGRQLALVCVTSSAVYSIDVVGLPHGTPRQLTSIQGYPRGLAWSSDGSRLIFAKDPGDGGELWQVTLNGELTQLPFGEEASEPAVPARGGRIAYVRGRNNVGIWRADLTVAHPEESAVKLIYSTRIQENPRYSPDGARIVFQSNRSGSTEIWVTDAQGRDPDRLTSFNGFYTGAPSWCSDGRRIAFDSRASGTSAVYVEDLTEKVPRRLVTSPDNLSIPVWSQDCRWLFATEGHDRLYRLPASGGPAERFTDHPVAYCVVVGDRVVFGAANASGLVLWIKPAGGGPEAPLENMPTLRYDDAWTASNSGIYYTDASSRPVSVNFYDFASRTTRRLLTLKQPAVPGGGLGIAVSPDGRWLLYTQTEEQQSEILLAPEN